MSGTRECSCHSCGISFRATRSDAKYCSPRCRQRVRRKPQDFRSRLLTKALRATSFLVGQIGPARSKGNRKAVYGLLVPRSYALTELNHFLAMPEPFTDAELMAVLRAEGIIDYNAAPPEAAKGAYAKRRHE
jgi:hypothetical protein